MRWAENVIKCYFRHFLFRKWLLVSQKSCNTHVFRSAGSMKLLPIALLSTFFAFAYAGEDELMELGLECVSKSEPTDVCKEYDASIMQDLNDVTLTAVERTGLDFFVTVEDYVSSEESSLQAEVPDEPAKDSDLQVEDPDEQAEDTSWSGERRSWWGNSNWRRSFRSRELNKKLYRCTRKCKGNYYCLWVCASRSRRLLRIPQERETNEVDMKNICKQMEEDAKKTLKSWTNKLKETKLQKDDDCRKALEKIKCLQVCNPE